MITMISISDAKCRIDTDIETAKVLLMKNALGISEVNGERIRLTYDINQLNILSSLLKTVR